MAIPLYTTGSLSPTFVPVPPVGVTVKLPSAFALFEWFPSILREPLGASDTLSEATGRRSIPTEDTYFSQIPDRQSSPEDEYMKTASNTHVEALCMQLKSPYKEVAYAHFCKELSVPEIAQQTGKNPKTIQTQLYRARAMLKKMLERGD